MKRKSYEQSYAELSEAVDVAGYPRPQVTRAPRHDDAEPGPSLLRVHMQDADFFDLTLPGLFVWRGELRGVAFTGSDLHCSTVNWTDLARCTFDACDLSRSDLRGCTFEHCSFREADLRGADLRCSSFVDCDLTGARLEGAVLTRDEEASLGLTPEQARAVAWSRDSTPPEG